MNEKIKEFAKQAWPGLPSHWWDSQDGAEAVEKFAHLIIEECAKLAEYQGYNQAFGLGGLRTKLHEHFEISGSDE